MSVLARSTYERWCALLQVEPDERLRPTERKDSLAAWMDDALVATLPAQAKLKTWARDKPREAWNIPGDPAAVLATIAAFGDEVLAHTAARVIAALPPPVRSYSVGRVTFWGLGLTLLGSASAPPPRDDRPWFVPFVYHVEGDCDLTAGLLAHELAHCWLLPEPAADETVRSALWQQTVRSRSIDLLPDDVVPMATQVRLADRRHEREAITLAATWGYQPIGAAARDSR